MKNSKEAVLKRQNDILQKIIKEKSILIPQVAKEFGISVITLRRDLDELESKGLITRFHGGAQISNNNKKEDPAYSKDPFLQRIKKIIAEEAARLVEDGDTIFINSSTTCLAMLEFLKDKNITVITNNANVLSVEDTGKAQIVFTGGMINSIKHSMVGDVAVQMIKQVHANKSFIGVSGINDKGDLSTAVLQETMVNIAMMEQTNHSIVILADSSKIGVQHNFNIGSLNQATHLITDYNISENQKKIINTQSLKLIIATPDK